MIKAGFWYDSTQEGVSLRENTLFKGRSSIPKPYQTRVFLLPASGFLREIPEAASRFLLEFPEETLKKA